MNGLGRVLVVVGGLLLAFGVIDHFVGLLTLAGIGYADPTLVTYGIVLLLVGIILLLARLQMGGAPPPPPGFASDRLESDLNSLAQRIRNLRLIWDHQPSERQRQNEDDRQRQNEQLKM